MSYSNRNPAWDRMLKGQHDARIQFEAQRAAELMSESPTLKRDDALRQAAREYEQGTSR